MHNILIYNYFNGNLPKTHGFSKSLATSSKVWAIFLNDLPRLLEKRTVRTIEK